MKKKLYKAPNTVYKIHLKNLLCDNDLLIEVNGNFDFMQINRPIVSIADEIIENALIDEGFVDQSAEIEVLRGV